MTPPATPILRWSPEVAAARAAGEPIVALETSVFAQGLRPPANREAYDRIVAAVRDEDAVPALTAVTGGAAAIGLEPSVLDRFMAGAATKVSARDLGQAIAGGSNGATTVAGALAIVRAARLEVFATGGIGGVHRRSAPDDPLDESADLLELSRTSAIVVCAGAKSILDLPATLERLESYGVAVIGYGTGEFPSFFTVSSGLPVPATAESPVEIVNAFRAQRAIGHPGALLVVQPPPPSDVLDARMIEGAIGAALAHARIAGIRGAAVTPFLLAEVERATGGASTRVNVALLESNAALAARLASLLAAEGAWPRPLLRFESPD